MSDILRGLVRAVAQDGSVWWVRPASVPAYQVLRFARTDDVPLDAPLDKGKARRPVFVPVDPYRGLPPA